MPGRWPRTRPRSGGADADAARAHPRSRRGSSASSTSHCCTRPRRRRSSIVALILLLLTAVCVAVLLPLSHGGSAPSRAQQQQQQQQQEQEKASRVVEGVEYVRPAVLARFTHDPSAFLQGFEFDKRSLRGATQQSPGHVWESTGLYGKSKLRRWDLESGKVLQEIDLDSKIFGEGLTVLPASFSSSGTDEIILLTWREHVVLVFDPDTLQEKRRHSLDTEGWGICSIGDRLVVSDGSANLYIYDAKTFTQMDRFRVQLHGKDVPFLNELEIVDGKVWANIWFQNLILVINLETRKVEQVIDVNHVVKLALDDPNDQNAVLNGIAFDHINRRMYISGKLWSNVYQIDMP